MGLWDFFTPEEGQKRRKWLESKLDEFVAEPVNYFLGPTGIPEKVQAAGQALEFTDAGDMQAAADASRDMWNNPTLGNAANLTAAGVALAMPLYSSKLGEGIMSVADDMVRAHDPDQVNAFRVWHGSPHDFDKFSMDKIGTGEGAQDLGRGLYFYDEQAPAELYRNPAARWGDVAAMKRYSDNGPSVVYETAIDAEPEEFLDVGTLVKGLPRESALREYAEARIAAETDPDYAAIMRENMKVSNVRDADQLARRDGFAGLSRKRYGGETEYLLFDDSLAHILSKNGQQVNTPEANRLRGLMKTQ